MDTAMNQSNSAIIKKESQLISPCLEQFLEDTKIRSNSLLKERVSIMVVTNIGDRSP